MYVLYLVLRLSLLNRQQKECFQNIFKSQYPGTKKYYSLFKNHISELEDFRPSILPQTMVLNTLHLILENSTSLESSIVKSQVGSQPHCLLHSAEVTHSLLTCTSYRFHMLLPDLNACSHTAKVYSFLKFHSRLIQDFPITATSALTPLETPSTI